MTRGNIMIHRLAALTALLLLAWMTGCTSGPKRHPVPASLTMEAQVIGLPGVRKVLDPYAAFAPSMEDSLAPAARLAREQQGPLTLLAISGGGADGAFGAGFLNGWTATGTRPTFDIVTGISTGSIIAPLAFLGADFDDELKESYTTVADKDIYRRRNLISILSHWDAAMDTAPLLHLLHQRFNDKVLALIAEEHRKGRRLYVGTTDLDALALVAWDMGAIAASGHPQAKDIFCQVVLASASIPGAFPSVSFEVEAAGQRYDELHADGGVLTQVFGAGLVGKLMSMSGRTEGRMYVVRNDQFSGEWKAIKRTLPMIAGRAIDGLVKSSGLGDIYRAYVIALETGLEFNLVAIPSGFEAGEQKGLFDKNYMNRLYQVGYELARTGNAWQKEPPGFLFIKTRTADPTR